LILRILLIYKQDKKIKALTLDELEFGNCKRDYKFALTGDTWQLLRKYYVDILPRICTKGVVFARMSSEQKQQLVMELIQLGYYVGLYIFYLYNNF
jgi:magnesium-transporting ATPase (P-type)